MSMVNPKKIKSKANHCNRQTNHISWFQENTWFIRLAELALS